MRFWPSVGVLMVAIGAQAQTRAFEVASVKPNRGVSRDMALNLTPGGGLTATNVTLRTLIKFAYDLRDYQLSGGPAWLDSEGYDIVAKGLAADAPKPEMGNAVQLRLQALLADRFHLAFHPDTKEMPVFALVQDKGGAKLEQWKEGDLPGPHAHSDNTKMTCRKQSMQNFATKILSDRMGTAVIDKTGLTGEYNFMVTFGPEPTGPTFLEALHEQLGLKLERQRGPVEIIVIDHVERPTPN